MYGQTIYDRTVPRRKSRQFALPALLLLTLLHCLPVYPAEVTVSLNDLPTGGKIAFALFDSANSFGALREATKIVWFPLDGRKLYRISNLAPGEYAMLVFHDANDNGLMDKNFIGIPREAVGFSNNYRPKGPPSYSRASFLLQDSKPVHFDVYLEKPLGDLGSISVGVGAVSSSTPYPDYDGSVYQIIPAVTYMGNRLQILGPNIQFAILGRGKVRLAATGTYRIGAYEEDKSDVLAGMGDREDTFLMGLALRAELPANTGLSLGYQHDILDNIGGGHANMKLSTSFQAGLFRFTPSCGISWLSSEFANHDFGVPASKATASRPAYELNDVFNVEAGLGVSVELTPKIMFMLTSTVAFMDERVRNSPIVCADQVFSSFSAVSYIF